MNVAKGAIVKSGRHFTLAWGGCVIVWMTASGCVCRDLRAVAVARWVCRVPLRALQAAWDSRVPIYFLSRGNTSLAAFPSLRYTANIDR